MAITDIAVCGCAKSPGPSIVRTYFKCSLEEDERSIVIIEQVGFVVCQQRNRPDIVCVAVNSRLCKTHGLAAACLGVGPPPLPHSQPMPLGGQCVGCGVAVVERNGPPQQSAGIREIR